MNKKKIFISICAVAIMAIVGIGVNKSVNNDANLSDLALANVEAMAAGEGSTTNTGPGKTYDCPGWGTGDGKMCMCENSYPCTQIPC